MSGTQAPPLTDPSAPAAPSTGDSFNQALSGLRERRRALQQGGQPAAAAPPASPAAPAQPGHNGGPPIGHNGGPPLPPGPAQPGGDDLGYIPGALAGLAPPAAPGGGPAAPGHAVPPAAAPGHEPPPETLITVNIGGTLSRVPLAELQQGYLRQADYTQKSQEAATAIRQANELGAAFSAQRDVLAARLAAIVQADTEEFSKPIDWVAERARDREAADEKLARFQNWQQRQAELRDLEESKAREVRARKEAVMRAGHGFLAQHVPGWNDPALRQRIQADLAAHARQVGYSDQELATMEVLDPRQILMGYESMLYRLLRGRRMPAPAAAPAPTLASARGRYTPPATARAAAQPGGTERPLGDAAADFEARPTVDTALGLLRARRGQR